MKVLVMVGLSLSSLIVFPLRQVPPQTGVSLTPNSIARAVSEFRTEHEHAIVEDLNELLVIPNAGNDTPNIRRHAANLVSMLKRREFKINQLAIKRGGPLLVGALNNGAARTVLFYCHYDGQPVEPSGWVNTRPLLPALRTAVIEDGGRLIPFPKRAVRYQDHWRIYARSAAAANSPTSMDLQVSRLLVDIVEGRG